MKFIIGKDYTKPNKIVLKMKDPAYEHDIILPFEKTYYAGSIEREELKKFYSLRVYYFNRLIAEFAVSSLLSGDYSKFYGNHVDLHTWENYEDFLFEIRVKSSNYRNDNIVVKDQQ